MNIHLSDHFTYKKLIRAAVPSVIMLLFTSVYEMVDGFFISNYVGEPEFAGLNLIMPYLMICYSFSLTLGTGGTALISLRMGQGRKEEANSIFTMLTYALFVSGVLFTILGIAFMRPVAVLLGAEGRILESAMTYGMIFLFACPFNFLEWGFQSFFVADEKAEVGLYFMIGAGVLNIILDYISVVPLGWGIAGAAAATGIGQMAAGVGSVLFFIIKKDRKLRFTSLTIRWRDLGKSVSNGFIEFVNNTAISIISIVYNFLLLKHIGEYGVSAFGIIMYVNFFFVAVYLGYGMAVQPVISYHYGAKNYKELKNVVKKSLVIMVVSSVVLTAIAVLTARPFAGIFAGYDKEFLEISTRAVRIYSISYIFTGVVVFTGVLFSALNDGKLSTIACAVRILVFQMASVLIMSKLFGVDGIWSSIIVAEALSAALCIVLFKKNKERYHY